MAQVKKNRCIDLKKSSKSEHTIAQNIIELYNMIITLPLS